jgi:hypothetical protein
MFEQEIETDIFSFADGYGTAKIHEPDKRKPRKLVGPSYRRPHRVPRDDLREDNGDHYAEKEYDDTVRDIAHRIQHSVKHALPPLRGMFPQPRSILGKTMKSMDAARCSFAHAILCVARRRKQGPFEKRSTMFDETARSGVVMESVFRKGLEEPRTLSGAGRQELPRRREEDRLT